ncbi:branched-chain amino acid ABC transporter ATP-binding protein/permease [Dactylosporangium sp. AC04546]|uniref:branched-chain amino acid ABC transporter ATP-binding protein/permease n=1 Tax=Dactylosporangium sp. AC04546 TaxID=2862460 RepID=UPI001EDF0E26|nr:branched-chain amino acid ABC transporter ATP-binding protein/permease [Dactylosporangium sp. AC04546]WVK81515.1 branched-chain amino acid ABC transporter ATP-binding protein/permease [Dactylosporangium sp. AC04546]
MKSLLVAFLVLAALGLFAPDLGMASFYLILLGSVCFWIAQATSWNLLSGYSGYFSFGQAAYVGVGAYTTAVLTGRHGVGFFWTLPLAAVLCGLLALGIGAVAFRLGSLRGEIFALLTLAVPFILAAFARINRSVDGGQGTTLPLPEYPEFFGTFQQFQYLLALAVAAVAVAVAFLVQRTRAGSALTAIHDNEDVAEVLGVPTFRYKMLAIVASGVLGGVAGSVYALQIGFVTVESVFGLTIPLFVIVMGVLGGRSHWLGPVIGAVLIVTLQDRLSSYGLDEYNAIFLGAILAILVATAPAGLYARLRARPYAALAGFVVVFGVLYILNVWGEMLDWLVAGMLAAALVAIVLGTRRSPAAPAVAAPAHLPEPIVEDVGEPPAIGPVLVECREVAKYYGGVHALEDVTLDIRSGELIGLVGPNGSGKTTLVNLLSGATRPTRGVIRVDGHDITRLPPHRIAHVGLARTYQIPKPFDSMTVRDNVATAIMFGRTPMSLRQARPLAERHLATVALDHLADARPGRLNLHQRQLLEMARAIASDPKVLLLDEALAGLNPAEVDNAVRVVRRIHSSGITIVIVEHLLRVLNQLATRIVVLDRGSLLADGDPQTVMSDPAVVRAYLGKQAHV